MKEIPSFHASLHQVRYIEIIRGTSGELDVRGGTQVINVVLNDALSSVSFAYEVNMDRHWMGSYSRW